MPLDPEQQRYLDKAHESTDRVVVLLAQIRDSSYLLLAVVAAAEFIWLIRAWL